MLKQGRKTKCRQVSVTAVQRSSGWRSQSWTGSQEMVGKKVWESASGERRGFNAYSHARWQCNKLWYYCEDATFGNLQCYKIIKGFLLLTRIRLKWERNCLSPVLSNMENPLRRNPKSQSVEISGNRRLNAPQVRPDELWRQLRANIKSATFIWSEKWWWWFLGLLQFEVFCWKAM